MIKKIKDFLGVDIKEEKYKLSDDPVFGRRQKKWSRPGRAAPPEWSCDLSPQIA